MNGIVELNFSSSCSFFNSLIEKRMAPLWFPVGRKFLDLATSGGLVGLAYIINHHHCSGKPPLLDAP